MALDDYGHELTEGCEILGVPKDQKYPTRIVHFRWNDQTNTYQARVLEDSATPSWVTDKGMMFQLRFGITSPEDNTYRRDSFYGVIETLETTVGHEFDPTGNDNFIEGVEICEVNGQPFMTKGNTLRIPFRPIFNYPKCRCHCGDTYKVSLEPLAGESDGVIFIPLWDWLEEQLGVFPCGPVYGSTQGNCISTGLYPDPVPPWWSEFTYCWSTMTVSFAYTPQDAKPPYNEPHVPQKCPSFPGYNLAWATATGSSQAISHSGTAPQYFNTWQELGWQGYPFAVNMWTPGTVTTSGGTGGASCGPCAQFINEEDLPNWPNEEVEMPVEPWLPKESDLPIDMPGGLEFPDFSEIPIDAPTGWRRNTNPTPIPTHHTPCVQTTCKCPQNQDILLDGWN